MTSVAAPPPSIMVPITSSPYTSVAYFPRTLAKTKSSLVNLADDDYAEEIIKEESFGSYDHPPTSTKAPSKQSIMQQLTSRIMAHHEAKKTGDISYEETYTVKVVQWTALLTRLSQNEIGAVNLVASLIPDESVNFEDSI